MWLALSTEVGSRCWPFGRLFSARTRCAGIGSAWSMRPGFTKLNIASRCPRNSTPIWKHRVEPIYVSHLHGDVNAHTFGGLLNMDGIEGSVNARTSGGSITLAGGKGQAIVHTSGGGIFIKDAAGSVDASTSGGIVNASLLGQPNANCRLYTSGGRIDVRLDRDVMSILTRPLPEAAFGPTLPSRTTLSGIAMNCARL